MSSHSEDRGLEPAFKKLRKGTRSCWECKRRKARCSYSAQNPSLCLGCQGRGTQCVSQDQPDVPGAPAAINGLEVHERLTRIESLLKSFAQHSKLSPVIRGRSQAETIDSLERSLGIDAMTPESSDSEKLENVPVMSLFDNGVFRRGRRDDNELPSTDHPRDQEASPQISQLEGLASISQKTERLKQLLLTWLPSQEAVDIIENAGNGWWLVRRHTLPCFNQGTKTRLLGSETLETLLYEKPLIIAKYLLWLVLGLQQLPIGFDHSSLRLSHPVDVYMKSVVALISSHINSDDEMVSSVGGLETLYWMAIYNSNAGKPRSSWLCYRRALSISQLLGLHRHSTRKLMATDHMPVQYLNEIWYCLLEGDRYLSLILGLPYTATFETFDAVKDDDEASKLTPAQRYSRRLIHIASLLVERNQSTRPPSFAATQDIDEKLEAISKELPADWWDLPEPGSTRITEEAGICFDKVVGHIWHYQLLALIHLPFLLHAQTEKRHAYSRTTCLHASREMMKRYIVLRKDNRSFSCKILEFQIFTAAVTVMIAILGTTAYEGQARGLEAEDWHLVEEVVNIMENLGSYPGEAMSRESAKVLKALQKMSRRAEGKPGDVTLRIPYFGTINVSVRGRCRDKMDLVPEISPPSITSFDTSWSHRNSENIQFLSDGQVEYPQSSFPNPGLNNDAFWGDWTNLQDPNSTVFQNWFDPSINSGWDFNFGS